MTEVLIPSRRGFLRVLTGLIAAPAVVKATSLMTIAGFEGEFVVTSRTSGLLTIDQLTREAISLWKNSNKFLQEIEANERYSDIFALPNYSIGTSLRIRLPRDYKI